MTQVIATARGYFGGMLRDAGDVFSIDDEIMSDEKRRPSWVKPAKFGGKGDHDNDGKVGGAKPADDAEKPSGRAKGKAKGETVEKAEPFADAPEPVAVAKGNGVKEALGTEPDWVAPKPID